MNIQLKKFGTTLTSRDEGRGAFNALQSSLRDLKKDEELLLDFEGVNTFSPSWGDEFISNLAKLYKERLILLRTQNPSVTETLDMLSKIHDINFNFKDNT